MDTKICSRCGEHKINTIEFFNKTLGNKSGLTAMCKKCRAAKQREYDIKNRELIRGKRKVHYIKNKKAIIAYQIKYDKHRYHTDPAYRYKKILRIRIRDIYKGRSRSKKSQELIGCTWEELAQHLENKFLPGMTHDNHGEWHIDHIRPLSSFDLSSSEDEKMANHYTNLQPLWASDNLSKGSTWRKESTC